MRRVSLALIFAFVATSSATATASPGSGSFSLPFREDHARYVLPSSANPNGVFKGTTRDDSGCKKPDAKGHRDCLPAAATMVMLANGSILYWNAIEGEEDVQNNAVLEGGVLARNDQTRVLRFHSAARWLKPSPVDGGGRNSHPEDPLVPGMKNDTGPNNDGGLFCSDQKLLADGRVLAVGGTDYYADPAVNDQYGVLELEGVRSARIFDGKTNLWTKAADMNYGRWYPSLVTLSNGNVLVVSGVAKLVKPFYPSHMEDSGTNVKPTETYDVKHDRWIDNTDGGANSAAARSLPLVARLHLLPNGNVYYDAAGQAYSPSGQAYDEATWNVAAVYDPTKRAWHDLGIPGMGTPFPGYRGSTFSAVLPMRAPYRSASFLTAGGVLGPTPGSYLPVADSRVTTIAGSRGNETMTTVSTGPMGRARWFTTAVPLPDGTVLATSGGDLDEVVTPGRESPIRQAEIFTPTYDAKGNVTGGGWRDVAVAHRSRTYHNNAVLLPDGRVLVGGHAPILRDYSKNGGAINTPVREFANNYKDASFEIYSPPYLSRGPRPVIGRVPTTLTRGSKLVIPIRNVRTADIKNVVLMRNTAQTHLIDADARTVELVITKRTASTITVAVPAGRAVLPPGPYLLFVNRKTSSGPVPSVAKQVFLR